MADLNKLCDMLNSHSLNNNASAYALSSLYVKGCCVSSLTSVFGVMWIPPSQQTLFNLIAVFGSLTKGQDLYLDSFAR